MIVARLIGALFAVGLSTGAITRAAPLDAREREARADYAAGRYQKAVDGFAALFADTADPVLLRNIGRCYQKMKRPQEAIDSFQEYLHKAKNLSKAERQEIEGFIKEMEAVKASEAAAAPPSAPPPISTAPQTPPPSAMPPTPPAATPTGASVPPAASTGNGGAAVSSATADATAPTTPGAAGLVTAPSGSAPVSDEGRAWRIAGIATAAGGVALVAVGLAYGLAAKNAADSVGQQYSTSIESDGKRDVTLQWVGYGAGAAALAAGAILYVHGMSSGHAPETTARLHLRGAAAFDRNGGGLVLRGSF